MRQSFVLSMRRYSQHRTDEDNSSILPMASAPQTTQSARESSDARVTTTMLERCGGGSLSIQLFNKITICSLRFRMLGRFFFLLLFLSLLLAVYLYWWRDNVHAIALIRYAGDIIILSLFRSFSFILQSEDIYLSSFFPLFLIHSSFWIFDSNRHWSVSWDVSAHFLAEWRWIIFLEKRAYSSEHKRVFQRTDVWQKV